MNKMSDEELLHGLWGMDALTIQDTESVSMSWGSQQWRREGSSRGIHPEGASL